MNRNHPTSSHRLVVHPLRALVGIAALVAAVPGRGAQVTFETPAALAGSAALDAVLSYPGYMGQTFVQAMNFGGPAQSITTAGGQTLRFSAGVEFRDREPIGSATAIFFAAGERDEGLFVDQTDQPGLDQILKTHAWAPRAADRHFQVLRIGGLTAGATYLATLVSSDMRPASAQRVQAYTGTGKFDASFGRHSTARPSYVIARFVADASGYQDIVIRPEAGGVDSTLAGFTLHSAVPLRPPGEERNQSSGDVLWLDFQPRAGVVAPLHNPVSSGAAFKRGTLGVTVDAAATSGILSGDHGAMLLDYVAASAGSAQLTLRISGLPAGSYEVESWHFDGGEPGAVSISGGPEGRAAAVLAATHAFGEQSAKYAVKAEANLPIKLIFRGEGPQARVRLNGLRLRPAGSAPSLPGCMVDIDYANTCALSGMPDPFFTDDATSPEFMFGQVWRRRSGFGFDACGNREVFEKDANGGFGDATPLVTVVRGLPARSRWRAYVAFLSRADEPWQVKAGRSASKMETFHYRMDESRLIDLGLSREPESNRHQLLGEIGEVEADENGDVWLYSDDGDGMSPTSSTRSWLEGFFLRPADPTR